MGLAPFLSRTVFERAVEALAAAPSRTITPLISTFTVPFSSASNA
ncbi:MAG: hypothetical protein JW388_1278 [Nitrospira sp.]|nr:hypothetical protein [Nitrospira sp.]